jgi:hypothetical protein
LIEALSRRMRLRIRQRSCRLGGWRSGRSSACAASILACAAAGAAGPPAAGRYVAQMCVAVPNAEPTCGRADIEWRAADRAVLRVSDVAYWLRLRTSQLEVVLKHGAMQIDAFTATYEWDGATLRFFDADKSVRYEIRSQTPLVARPKGPAATPPAPVR